MKVFYIVCMVLMIAMMQHTCLAEITLDNTKEWDAEKQTITIFNEDTKTKLMTVKLISARSSVCTFTEIYEVRNFEAYTPDRSADFKARTNTVVGNGAVTNVEWFIEQNVSYVVNVTDYGIKQIEETVYNNKTGENETILVNKTVIIGYHDETRYKDVWVDYQPYDKVMSKDQVQRIKVIYHKVPELGPFRIQTIPMFKGVECSELTWWSGSWDRRRAIHIDNTVGDAVTDYQLKSVNLSSYSINTSSSRIVKESSGLEESFWNESVDVNGNLEFVWCNFSSLPSGDWINTTYYVYYQSSPNVSSVSDPYDTFISFFNGDLTGWTEVDPNNHIAFTNNRLELANLMRNEDAYVYQAIDIDDNIIIEWAFEGTTGHASGVAVYGMLSDNLDDFANIDNGFGVYGYSPNTYIRQSIRISDNFNHDVSPGTMDDATHYARTIRSGNTVTTYIYRDIARTDLDATTYKTQAGLPTLNYVYLVASWNSAGAYDYDGWMDDLIVRQYTTNEPEFWTVGAEEEYQAPTPTPTSAPTTSVFPAQYDELDLPLILYILMISLLYLLIAFRHGVAAVELSLIYLIFVFFFLLFQTVTMSVNYIYLTLFLLLFMISIAGITLEKRS